MKTKRFINPGGSIVKDGNGTKLALLNEVGGIVFIKKTPACSLGTYLYIVSLLREFGFEEVR